MSVSTIVSSVAKSRSAFLCQSVRPFTTVQNGHKSSQTSVDPSTVSHHSKLAENWWDDSGFLKALQSMNSLRVPLVRDGLFQTGAACSDRKNTPRPLEGLNIVDVGCGGGLLSEPLARLGASVTGIDASAELIEIAQQHAQLDPSLQNRLTYIHTLAETHACEAEAKYDAVVSSEVIEHVKDKHFFIEQCTKLLKPRGSLFITTLNRTTLSWLGGVVMAEYVARLVPQGTHQWELFIQPSELQIMLEKYGCFTKLLHGMCYNPLTDEWHWSQNVSINYAIHAVKTD
ncbi:ubiquinone biosynthesis O-methyltransferase, mitochondrial [Frankliniella occidentalis]|uniref:Ubiquinone biosynthesis O-methyltransferase, mitochondrial n=1 Tax=Frankliniella occidentalis TaxID=133901 RepID=A0A6J1T3J9_FRAOC|nr:ubiquinone biosynthesis O-methyltransferase, mitochondrial [Frankliniella occidentalis]XP_026288156.1 ubiquinone biosynthesis O-methyltransferase, mitochondrial [Frankliniella occidentalis]